MIKKILCALLIELLVLSVPVEAFNIKYDDGKGSVSTLVNDPDCLAMVASQGVNGNGRFTCTLRAMEAPVTVPQFCTVGGKTFQVVQGPEIPWSIAPGIATYSSAMKKGNVYVYKIRTGDTSPFLVAISFAEYAATYVPERTVVISQTPCDFDATKSTVAWGVGTNPTAYFSVGTPNIYSYVALKANTDYYINVGDFPWQALGEDGCLDGADCRFVMSIRNR